MKRFLITISFLITVLCPLLSQAQVTFRMLEGVSNTELKVKVESNVSRLLSEINRASYRNEQLNLAGIQIEKKASERLRNLWHNMPFCCEWKNNVQSCIQDFIGYEIRQIPVVLKPLGDTYKGELHKELTISFNKQGVITGVRTSIGNNSYLALLSGGKANLDMRMRREILKYLEDYRSYYTEKNLEAIEKLLDRRSLDITKSLNENGDTAVSKHLRVDKNWENDKQKILSNLNKLFQQSRGVEARISDMELQRHGANPFWYAVWFRLQLFQGDEELHNSTDGYYFLLWDFTEESNPVIHSCLLFFKKKDLAVEDFFIPHY